MTEKLGNSADGKLHVPTDLLVNDTHSNLNVPLARSA